MAHTAFGNCTCDQVLEYLDCSLEMEIPESEVGILRHIEQCAYCTAEVEARRAMRNRLRGAVLSIEVPLLLEDKVRGRAR